MKKNLYITFKRFFDIAASFIGIIILLPLFIVIAVLIKIQSPGPVIHKRKCIKRGGFYFMYKFRSMVYDAENLTKYLSSEQIEEYRRNIKVIHDPRITRIGKFLRKTSLDEIPQLFNVLRGDMSLVGVRPVSEEEIYLYGDDLDEILSVKPGITGYWQTHGRSNASYESGKRQELELYYVRHQSFMLDLEILFSTAVILLTRGWDLCKRIITRGFIYSFYKFIFDEIVSGLLLVILLPLLVVIAVFIKINDGGSVLHRRYCVGKDNKKFIMYKFRTMCSDADNYEKYFSGEELVRVLRGEKTRNDPRVTKIGKFLRETSIDEIPQLISVFMGNMSLVGPRPVIEREAEFYGSMKKFLLSVRPGITGWWQVNGRDDLAYLSEESKQLQLYYVFNRSVMLDLKILVKTIFVVLKKEGAK